MAVATEDQMPDIPLGRYLGDELDPNATPFLKSIGYSDEIATKYGSYPTTITFSKTGPNGYILNISQVEIDRSQDIPFRLDEQTTTPRPGGKSMTSLFKWDAEFNALRCVYSNSEDQNWTINYFFDQKGCKMMRDSGTVQAESTFTKAADQGF